MIKTREFPKENYKSIYFNGKTLRIALDTNKPIKELAYPEFYDVKITGKCEGSCPYCYMDSKSYDEDYDIKRLEEFFNQLTLNQKPYQLAYGGGEPTLHTMFTEIMKMTRDYGIAPNYTTNGMWSNDPVKTEQVINTTKKYCEGIAVSCHPHLEKYWTKAVELYLDNGIFTNFHVMVSDKKSIDYFFDVYKQYKGRIKYFVLLPLIDQGRCTEVESNYDYLFDEIEKWPDISDIAFGAKFYERLKTENLDVSLYEPEIMSKFIDLKDGAVYNSSFDTKEPIKFI